MKKFINKMLNQKILNRYRKQLYGVKEHLKLFESLCEQEVVEMCYGEFNLNVDDDCSKLLALVGYFCERKLNLRPYDEQYICTLAMYDGLICEMKTGEGKSLVSLMLSVMQAKAEYKVHIATVNDYLAKRDMHKFLPVYSVFNLKVSFNERRANKKKLYLESDIVYSSSKELIFDYLKNELAEDDRRYSYPLECVIIDEIDFVLLDNANSRFSVGTQHIYKPNLVYFEMAQAFCNMMKGYEVTREELEKANAELPEPKAVHYVYSYYNNNVYLTEEGFAFLDNFLGANNITNFNVHLYKIILCTLEAKLFYLRGRDYIVRDNEVVLISRFNGRLMPTSHVERDLHTAIEYKESTKMSKKSLVNYSLSYQIFFDKYDHMVGMSGTVNEAAEEFVQIFGKESLMVPTHLPCIRKNHADIFFENKDDKYRYLIEYLKYIKPTDQPALIVTESEQESELIMAMCSKAHIQANLLNSQTTHKEEELVKNAGRHGQITISTNMAGRGTDIVIDDRAAKVGGLLVVSLNRYISKRIDNQVRGRAGRQGNPGECLFLVSLEDRIWKHASKPQKEQIQTIVKEGETIRGRHHRNNCKKLVKILDELQSQLQQALEINRLYNYLLDVVVERHRELVFQWRDFLLKEDLLKWLQAEMQGYDMRLFEEYGQFLPEQGMDNSKKWLLLNLNAKGEEYGLDLAQSLLQAIVKMVVAKQWLIYKRDIEDMRHYLKLYRMEPKALHAEYVRRAFEELAVFKNQVITLIAIYFLASRYNNT